MAQELSNKYFVRKNTSDEWQDITTLFDGIKVLAVTGMNVVGDAVNIYTEQWINSQEEDYMVTTKDEQENDVVIRKNVDVEMTFIAGTRYSSGKNVDTQTVYDAFVEYLCGGDFYLKTMYSGKSAHVVCISGVKPTTERLHRGMSSYIMATATLHTLDAPHVQENGSS